MLKHALFQIIALTTLLVQTTAIAQFARVQAMWASPDPALEEVDIYVSAGGFLLDVLQNIESTGDASQFISGPANVEYDIGVAPGNSVSINDTIKSYSAVLANNSINILVGTGVLDPGLYAPNPDGKDISVSGYLNTNAREFSAKSNQVDIGFFHGSTDLPTVDITIDGTSLLAGDVAYGEFDDYVSITPGIHTFEVKDAATGDIICIYDGDFSSYAGWAAMVFIAGFMDPQANQNGVPLLMGAVLAPSASAFLFQRNITGIQTESGEIANGFELRQNYPNPFNPQTTIQYAIPRTGHISVRVFNVFGGVVRTLISEEQSPGTKLVIWDGKNDAGAQVAAGTYWYQLSAEDFIRSRQMVYVK